MREARHSAEAARPVVPPAVMMVIALPRKGSLIGGKVSDVGDDVCRYVYRLVAEYSSAVIVNH